MYYTSLVYEMSEVSSNAKSIATHFGGSINSSNLLAEIDAGGLGPTLLRVDTIGDVVDIVFDAALTAGEQTTLDSLIASHNSAITVKYTSTIQLTPKNSSIVNSVFTRCCVFIYEGSDKVGTIDKIFVFGYKDSLVTNFSVKVIDKTNNVDIAVNTFTNITESSLEMTPLANIPKSQAIIEVSVKKTGGSVNQNAYIDSVMFYLY